MEKTGEPNSVWWRFDKYEVRAGCIAPARGARLSSYVPWDVYESAGDKRTPCGELLDIMREVLATNVERPGRVPEVQPHTEERILGWCSKYGLLGILHHRTTNIVLAPRWVAGMFGEPFSVPTQQRFMRSAQGVWWDLESPQDLSPGGLRSELREAGSLVPREKWRRRFEEPGALVLRSVDDPTVENRSLDEALGPFFPSISASERATYAYPRPDASEFWALYAEPLVSFVDAAMGLTAIVDGLAFRGSANPAHEWSVKMARAHLDVIIGGVSPSLRTDAGEGFRLRWRTPSLFATLAMMIVWDALERRHVRRCVVCSETFVNPRLAKVYCSERCRLIGQKRNQRAREKAENEAKKETKRARRASVKPGRKR